MTKLFARLALVLGCLSGTLRAQTFTNATLNGTLTINASSIGGSAIIPPAMLGTGLASSVTILYGDGVWRSNSNQIPTISGGTAGEFLSNTGSALIWAAGLNAPGSSTLNGIAIFNTTLGTSIVSSTSTLDNSGNMILLGSLTVNRNVSGSAPGLGGLSGNLGITAATQDAGTQHDIFDAFGGSSTMHLRRSDGTNGSKTAVLSNEVLGVLAGDGYNSSAYANSRAAIQFRTTENWSLTNEGEAIQFITTATGTTTITLSMEIWSSSGVTIGPAVTTGGTDPGAGNLTLGNAVQNFFTLTPGSGFNGYITDATVASQLVFRTSNATAGDTNALIISGSGTALFGNTIAFTAGTSAANSNFLVPFQAVTTAGASGQLDTFLGFSFNPSTGTLATPGNISVSGSVLQANNVIGPDNVALFQNVNTAATSYALLGVANLTHNLVNLITSTGYSGSYMSGGPAGESANVFTLGSVPMSLGTNSIAALNFDTSQNATFTADILDSGLQWHHSAGQLGNVQSSFNSFLGGFLFQNSNSGAAAVAALQIQNNSHSFNFEITSTGFSGSGITGAPAGEAAIINVGSATPMVFGVNSIVALTLAAATNPTAKWNGPVSDNHTVLTYASPTSVTVGTANSFETTTVNATGSVTFNASAGGTAGQDMTIIINNDATSGKVITFGSNFRSVGTLTGTASKAATIRFKSNGTSWFEVSRSLVL